MSATLDLVEPVQAGDPPATGVAAELVDRAEISDGKSLVKLAKAESELAALRADAKKATFSMATTKEADATRAFRARCVSMRTSFKDRCERLRAPANDFRALVIAREKELTAGVKEVEDVVDKIIKADEGAREAAKKAKAEAEAKRISSIRGKIDLMRSYPVEYAGLNADSISSAIVALDALAIGDDYAEFKTEAEAIKLATLSKMRQLHAAAVSREAAAAQLAEQQAELDRQRSEDQRRRKHQDNIAFIKACVNKAAGRGVAALDAAIAYVNKINVEPEVFQEFADEALRAKIESLEELNRMRTDAVAAAEAAAETARVAAEQAVERQRLEEQATAIAKQQKELADAQAAKTEQDLLLAQREAQEVADKAAAEQRQSDLRERGRQIVDDIITAEIIADSLPADTRPNINLGTIGARLGFTITKDFVESALNIPHVERNKNAMLWREADFTPICNGVIAHIEEVKARHA